MLAGYAPGEGPSFEDPEKAVEHWGREYSSNPRDLDSAISYAQSLKAAGQKTQALAVLEQVHLLHRDDRRLASEYGRLALELDQVGVAKPLLEAADDPATPDWRVVMARGTVLAKEGHYKEAVPFYERALALKPDHPSVMSNLALAYTMSGEAAKGEELLRRATAARDASPKVRQNLALVLGLQGKYDEAAKIASVDLPMDKAQANLDLLRRMARPSVTSAAPGAAPSKPKPGPSSAVPVDIAQVWETDVVEVPPPRRKLAFDRTATKTLGCLRQAGNC
jgi:Flp pilus assembly protein TadD